MAGPSPNAFSRISKEVLLGPAGLTLPRLASPRTAGLDHRQPGRKRDRPPGQVLIADGDRHRPFRKRNCQLETSLEGHQHRRRRSLSTKPQMYLGSRKEQAMPSRHKLYMQIRMLFRPRQDWSGSLQEELRFHLDQQISEKHRLRYERGGSTWAQAMRSFGDPGLVREQVRATWNWYNLDKLGRDLKYGVRTLLRSPGFAVVSVVVMALQSIGATTFALYYGARGAAAAASVSRFWQADNALRALPGR